jgi:hypothetical protein
VKWFFTAVVLSVLAMLSKEQGFLAIIVCACYDVFVTYELSPFEAIGTFIIGAKAAQNAPPKISGMTWLVSHLFAEII